MTLDGAINLNETNSYVIYTMNSVVTGQYGVVVPKNINGTMNMLIDLHMRSSFDAVGNGVKTKEQLIQEVVEEYNKVITKYADCMLVIPMVDEGLFTNIVNTGDKQKMFDEVKKIGAITSELYKKLTESGVEKHKIDQKIIIIEKVDADVKFVSWLKEQMPNYVDGVSYSSFSDNSGVNSIGSGADIFGNVNQTVVSSSIENEEVVSGVVGDNASSEFNNNLNVNSDISSFNGDEVESVIPNVVVEAVPSASGVESVNANAPGIGQSIQNDSVIGQPVQNSLVSEQINQVEAPITQPVINNQIGDIFATTSVGTAPVAPVVGTSQVASPVEVAPVSSVVETSQVVPNVEPVSTIHAVENVSVQTVAPVQVSDVDSSQQTNSVFANPVTTSTVVQPSGPAVNPIVDSVSVDSNLNVNSVEAPKPVESSPLEGTMTFTSVVESANDSDESDSNTGLGRKGFVNLAVILGILVGVTFLSIQIGKYLYSVYGV